MSLKHIADCFAAIDRELWIVTSACGDERSGLVATSVMQASIVPEIPRILVTIGRQHETWKQIEASGCFALHLLDENQLELVWRFGLQSGRDADKFNGLNLRSSTSGNPILSDAPAWLDCRIENRMETGDRTAYLAAVVEGGIQSAVAPLTVSQMLARAPVDKLQQLKSQRELDVAWEADAINAWRQQGAAKTSTASPDS